jgi:hypothetical protein
MGNAWMTHPSPRTATLVSTQLVARFDRNGDRHIGLGLLRQVRRLIRDDLRDAGATGSVVWRLRRTPSGIMVTAMWHPRRDAMIEAARPARAARLEQHRQAAKAGIVNRRRLGGRCIPWFPSAESGAASARANPVRDRASAHG